MLRRLLCLALIASLLFPSVEPAFASTMDTIRDFDIDILRFPLKMYDIVPSDWSMKRKAELSAVLDVVQATQDAANTRWYNVVGHVKNMFKINDERKDFMVATKQRVALQNQLEARPFHLDAGLHAHKLILKAADFAGSLDGTGPIYSELERRYNRVVTILIQRDRTSALNVVKRFQLDRDLKNEAKEIYALSKRLKDSKILSLATALVKGGSSKDGTKSGDGTLEKIVKYGAIAGGVIAIVGGIWKLSQSKSPSAPRRATDTTLAPSMAPAAAPVERVTATTVSDPAKLRTLMERYRLEAGKADPDAGTLRDLQLQMEEARERK